MSMESLGIGVWGVPCDVAPRLSFTDDKLTLIQAMPFCRLVDCMDWGCRKEWSDHIELNFSVS